MQSCLPGQIRSRSIGLAAMALLVGAIIATLSLLAGCGTGFDDTAAKGVGSSKVDLSRLIVHETHLVDPATSRPAQRTQIFFDRESGRQVSPAGLHEISAFSEGLAAARQVPGGPAGYVDRRGNVVIPFFYEWAGTFEHGRAWVNTTDGTGVIDRGGNWISRPQQYEGLGILAEDRIAFRIGEQWGFMNGKAQVVIAPQYAAAGADAPIFSEGLALIRDGGRRLAYVDRTGQIAFRLPEQAEQAYSFSDGLARVQVSYWDLENPRDEWVFVTRTGEVAFQLKPTAAGRSGRVEVGDFSEGLAAVSNEHTGGGVVAADIDFAPPAEGEKWGFINVRGEVVIPLLFDRVGDFHCGLSRVRVGDAWGFINSTGKMVIKPRFRWVSDFADGIAQVWYEGKISYIDTSGRVIVKTDDAAVTF